MSTIESVVYSRAYHIRSMMWYVIVLKAMTVAKDILSVRLSQELKDRLKEYADEKRWSMSQAAEYFIEQGLEPDKPEKGKPKTKK